jgi:hypothetical protein
VAVAGLGDSAPLLPAATRVLAGHEAHECHQRPRTLEPAEVTDLGDERHRRECRDAAQAGQLRDGFGVWLGPSDPLDLAIEVGPPRREVLHLLHVVLEGEPLALAFELERSQPYPETLGPLAAVEHAPVADEELAQAVPRGGKVLPHVFAGADQVPNSLLLDAGHGDGRKLAGAEQPGEFARVALIGLDPVAAPHRDERGSDHLARHAHRRQEAMQLEATRPGLVTASQLVRLPSEPPKRSSNDLRIVRDIPDLRLSSLSLQGGDDDPLAVDIEPDVGGNLLHGWLLRLRLWPRLVSRPRG